MYSFKEKQKHFAELQNSNAAALDLALLSQKNPLHPHLGKYSRNPERYANEILYQLLDIAKRDEIRNNRRPPVPEEIQPTTGKDDVPDSQKKEENNLPVVESEKEENVNVTQYPPSPDQQDKPSEVTSQVIEAKERAEKAEERAEEAELRAEKAEERADNTEAELKQEKKKVVTAAKPKAKSKSGKNTLKSTGTTSRTRKSRQLPSSTTTE